MVPVNSSILRSEHDAVGVVFFFALLQLDPFARYAPCLVYATPEPSGLFYGWSPSPGKYVLRKQESDRGFVGGGIGIGISCMCFCQKRGEGLDDR